jgi:WD40 repeat protein
LATDGKELVQFSLKSARSLRTLPLASRLPFAAAISPDGTSVAVSLGREIIEFDTRDGTESQRYKPERTGTQWHIAFHPTQPWLLAGGRGVVTIWDRDSAEPIAVLDTDTIQYVKTTALTTDGQQIALVPSSSGQSIQIFRIGG